MKKRIIWIIAAVVLLTVAGIAVFWPKAPGDNGNQPYEPDTPAPAPHEGTFRSEEGALIFNGDGGTFTIQVGPALSDLLEISEGEYTGTYEFLSGDLPPHGSMPVRYDVAHELSFTITAEGEEVTKVVDLGSAAEDGSTATVGVDQVTPERIPFLFHIDGKFITVEFLKK